MVTFTEGFDYYPNLTGVAGMASNGWVIPRTDINQLVAGRFGGQSFRTIVRTGSSFSWGSYRVFNNTVHNGVGLTGSFGLAYKWENENYRSWALGQDGSISLMFLVTAGEIAVYRGDGTALLGTTSGANISSANWVYIEGEFFVDDTTGYIRIYSEGDEVLNVSSVDTKAGSEVNINSLRTINSGDVSTGYIDDFYLSDSATRLGPSRVETIRPGSDVSVQWVPLSGVVNYAMVDETLVDGNTTYNQAGSIGDKDLYELDNLSSTPSQVHAVNLIGCVLKTDAALRTVGFPVVSVSVETPGDDFYLNSDYGYFTRMMEDNPTTLASWTAAQVNAMQAGPEVTS